ncbi:cytochrome b [Rhizobiaceae bacterium n13]|uniref:Cytochrome b n=1 Tax=Ferirhizobium litorale TaxID=2927786 RepID=A0AAE3Q9C0_9HYPH|nr:cytochrome b [Fererhizobium litorale]MDI7861455.1 cytochrome b [Fererhizobium litorale]MDI7921602.1 cytochrome b [Fererhizobium litorale]
MSRQSASAYDPLTILLHWLIAAIILGQIVLGFVMTRPSIDPALQFSLFQWHKSFGMLVLVLAALRLLHSLIRVRVAPAPGASRLEYMAARFVHAALLALALVVPFAGWMIASVSPLNIPTFAFNLVVVPDLPFAKSDFAEDVWTTVHTVLAYTMLALVLLHSGAALYHHYRRHDGVLQRMLRLRRSPAETPVTEVPTKEL